MERDDAATKVLEILRANPDGISRAGLMAWARLRIASDLTDEQLDAALVALGPAVSVDGGFIRLLGPSAVHPGPAADGQAAEGVGRAWTAPGQGGSLTPIGGIVDTGESMAGESMAGESMAGESAGGGGVLPQVTAPPGGTFSTASLVEAGPEGGGPPAGWVAGRRPRRRSAVASVIGVAVFLILAAIGSSGSGSGTATPTLVPGHAEGSIAPADQLLVGSCFVVPSATTFREVEIRPCTVAHDGEMVSSFDYEAPGASYPTEAEWETGVDARCKDAFETYTGLKWSEQGDLTYSWFYPAEDAWQQGSRTVQCYLEAANGTLTRSYRAAP